MIANASMEPFVVHSYMLGIVGEAHSFAVKLNPYSGLLVLCLIRNCRPSAIFRGITKVIINALNGHSVRSFTHVFKEEREARKPSVTHSYPAPSILGPFGVFGVRNSLLGMLIRPDGRRVLPVYSVPVGDRPITSRFYSEASAASCHSASNNLKRLNDAFPAVTIPEPRTSFPRLSLNSDKPSVSIPCNI